MMMVASLVVRSGCGTPLWLWGGKGGGVEMAGVVVGGVVMDRNEEYMGSLVMVVEEKKIIRTRVGRIPDQQRSYQNYKAKVKKGLINVNVKSLQIHQAL